MQIFLICVTLDLTFRFLSHFRIFLFKISSFWDIFWSKFKNLQLNIDKTSAAFQKGNTTYRIPKDILGVTRSLTPDIGAYQNKLFPKW